jgi:hypothetical protein
MWDLNYWPIALRAEGEKYKNPDGTLQIDPKTGKSRPHEPKKPTLLNWGAERWKKELLRRELWKYPGRGLGICLGPGKAPGGGCLIDVEGDGPGAEESFGKLLGALGLPHTPSWSSARGGHFLFTCDRERLADLLLRAGAKEGKGKKKGTWYVPGLPGLEFRIGGTQPNGSVSQFQSACPPSKGSDGLPRAWLVGPDTPVMELPESAYQVLEGLAQAEEARRSLEPAGKSKASAPKLTPEEKAARFLAKATPTRDEPDRGLLLSVVISRAGPVYDLSEVECVALVMEHYAPRCSPAWSEDEVKAAVRDIYEKTPERGVRLRKRRTTAEGWDTPYEPLPPDVEADVIRAIDAWPASIQGDKGSNKLYALVINVGRGHDLTKNQCLHYVKTYYNIDVEGKRRCVPTWSDWEIRRKIDDGYRAETRRGMLNIPLLAPGDDFTWDEEPEAEDLPADEDLAPPSPEDVIPESNGQLAGEPAEPDLDEDESRTIPVSLDMSPVAVALVETLDVPGGVAVHVGPPGIGKSRAIAQAVVYRYRRGKKTAAVVETLEEADEAEVRLREMCPEMFEADAFVRACGRPGAKAADEGDEGDDLGEVGYEVKEWTSAILLSHEGIGRRGFSPALRGIWESLAGFGLIVDEFSRFIAHSRWSVPCGRRIRRQGYPDGYGLSITTRHRCAKRATATAASATATTAGARPSGRPRSRSPSSCRRGRSRPWDRAPSCGRRSTPSWTRPPGSTSGAGFASAS